MSLGKLTALQERVRILLADIAPPWTLTGGAVLAGFHTMHRETRDLDLFFRGHANLGAVVRDVTTQLAAAGLAVGVLRTSPTFSQLDVRDVDEAVVRAGQPPPVQQVRLLEIGPGGGLDERGRLRVRRDDYRDPEGYKDRFEVLLAAGLPWINVSCFGVDEDKLIVVIEVPLAGSSQTGRRTSVNYSGPAKAAIEHDWDANMVLAIE